MIKTIKDIWNKYSLRICIIIGVIALFVPLLWKNRVEFNIAKFTEEWYKTILVYLGIGVLVLFFTDKSKEIKKRRLLNGRKSVVEQIKTENKINDYNNIISNVKEFLSITNEIEFLFNNNYLTDDEKFAKSEMEYYSNLNYSH